MALASIQIRLSPQSTDCISYKICNRLVSVNQAIKALSAFEVAPQRPVFDQTDSDDHFNNANSKQLFKGKSWLAGKDRQLTCSKTDTGFLINVPDVADFHISADGTVVTQLSSSSQTGRSIFEEVLLGPPLMLALALNQLFAFHASAVEVNTKAVLFVGESGFGKSTLAAWLNDSTSAPRLSDDICVVERMNNKLKLLPDFLQMKLPEDQQKVSARPVEIGAIVLLNRQIDSTVELTRLETLNAIKTLVNHSVATQLFDKPLAQQHLAFMSQITQDLPIYSLNYPNGQKYTQPIAEILTKQLN